MSRCLHGFPWHSLATRLYRLSLPWGLPGTSLIGTELLYIGFSWLSNLCSSMCRDPQEYIAWIFPYFSSSVLHVWFVYLDIFDDGWLVDVQLLFCWMLPPRLVQFCSQNSCLIVVKLFLHSLVSVHVVHPFSCIDTITAWKKHCLIFIGEVWLQYDRYEEVLCNPQSSSITGPSPSGCFVSYRVHSLGKSYPSSKKKFVYSTDPAVWTKFFKKTVILPDRLLFRLNPFNTSDR